MFRSLFSSPRRIFLVVFALLFLLGGIFRIVGSSKEPPKQDPAIAALPTPLPTPKQDVAAANTQTPPSPTVGSLTQPSKQKATVIKVVDGDTMSVSVNGATETIRIIGINTPETVDPRKSVECFGKEASAKAKEYIANAGNTVWLEADPTQGERDKYQRLLRYVFTNNGSVDYGESMIATGYAYEYTYNTPYKYQASYKQAQKDAESKKLGLWADNACLTQATPVPINHQAAKHKRK